MLFFDGHNASVMTGRSNFLGRLVRNCSKRQQIWLTRSGPMRPQTCHEHRLAVARSEFQHHIFVLLTIRKLTPFHLRAAHVLIEHIDDEDAVSIAEERLPESTQA